MVSREWYEKKENIQWVASLWAKKTVVSRGQRRMTRPVQDRKAKETQITGCYNQMKSIYVHTCGTLKQMDYSRSQHTGWYSCQQRTWKWGYSLTVLSFHYKEKSLRNVSSTFFNLCHKEWMQFWVQKGFQPSIDTVYFYKNVWMNSALRLPRVQCQAWTSTCHSSVAGCATPCFNCDRSGRVSRYIGQSPGTPSMEARGQDCGLERKWRIIHRASNTQDATQSHETSVCSRQANFTMNVMTDGASPSQAYLECRI